MKYLLDTNICIYIIKNKPEQVKERFLQCELGDIAISSITLMELMYGAYKSQNIEKSIKIIDEFVAPLDIINFGHKSADICGKIYADLSKKGKVIGLPDMQIAATAMARDYVLVTNNMKEFERISDLKLENWVAK